MKAECFLRHQHSGRNPVKRHWVLKVVMIIVAWVLCACSKEASLLPHSIYYLQGWGEEAQIWVLAEDGVTKSQITFEPAGITAYAVSESDGRLAIVSENRLYLIGPEGEDRELIADGSALDSQAFEYPLQPIIDHPVFSPDGKYLAYHLDGLHIYNLSTQQDEHILKDLGNLLGEPYVFASEVYSPESWSSDSQQLLFSMGYYEGSTLAIMEMGEEINFRRLLSGMPVCCTYRWTDDDAGILVANPTLTVDRPGLWRYDANTGTKTSLISDNETGDRFYFVGWPQQMPSGELYFFYYTTEFFSPEVGIPLKLAHSNSDGSDIREVRLEEFSVREVLWVQDELRAVVLGRSSPGTVQLIYLPSTDDPLQVLIEDAQTIHHLSWGP